MIEETIIEACIKIISDLSFLLFFRCVGYDDLQCATFTIEQSSCLVSGEYVDRCRELCNWTYLMIMNFMLVIFLCLSAVSDLLVEKKGGSTAAGPLVREADACFEPLYAPKFKRLHRSPTISPVAF